MVRPSGYHWTNGLRLESGAVGAGLTFRTERGWDRRGTYLERNEEVFDAEVFAILQAFRLLNKRGGQGQQYAVFSDSQAAIAWVQ